VTVKLKINRKVTNICTMNVEAVRRLLRAECKSHGDATIFAKRAGVSAALVSAILRGKREPRGKVLGTLRADRFYLLAGD